MMVGGVGGATLRRAQCAPLRGPRGTARSPGKRAVTPRMACHLSYLILGVLHHAPIRRTSRSLLQRLRSLGPLDLDGGRPAQCSARSLGSHRRDSALTLIELRIDRLARALWMLAAMVFLWRVGVGAREATTTGAAKRTPRLGSKRGNAVLGELARGARNATPLDGARFPVGPTPSAAGGVASARISFP